MTDQKVRVRFVTTYEKYRVTDAPFAVPAKLGRYGLSEVVNHLLDSDESAHQPFDFSVNGRLLRSSLKTFLVKHKVSTEDVITIEYTPAVSLSDESDSTEVPSWIGSLDTGIDAIIVAGCYDGQVKLLSKSLLTEVGAIAAHSEPIRAVKTWTNETSSAAFLATASKDQSVKCFRLAPTTNTSSSKKHNTTPSSAQYTAEQVALLSGHVNSVESVEYWAGQQILLSGDWSGNIFGWNVGSLGQTIDTTEEDGSSGASLKKKQKGSTGAAIPAIVRDLKPSFNIRAHTQSVSGLQVVGSSDAASKLFSCSWDHSLKEYDIGRQDCIATFASSKVMTSLHYSEAAALVATSHPDGKVRLWDPRKREEALCVGTYGSSAGNAHWIAQVRWHPTSATIFASTDYDGAVKVWDTRAAVPLGISSAHSGKGLCIDWVSYASAAGGEEEVRVVTGGSDCVLRSTPLIHTANCN